MASSWRGLGSIRGAVCEPCVRDVRVKGGETLQLGHLIPTRTWSLPVVLGRQRPVTVVGGGVFCVLREVPELVLRAETLDGAKLVVLDKLGADCDLHSLLRDPGHPA